MRKLWLCCDMLYCGPVCLCGEVVNVLWCALLWPCASMGELWHLCVSSYCMKIALWISWFNYFCQVAGLLPHTRYFSAVRCCNSHNGTSLQLVNVWWKSPPRTELPLVNTCWRLPHVHFSSSCSCCWTSYFGLPYNLYLLAENFPSDCDSCKTGFL